MAKLSSFYGIDVVMRPEKNERHHCAHFHAKYGGRTAVFDVLSREIIAQGKRPFPAIRLVFSAYDLFLQSWQPSTKKNTAI